MATVQDFGGLLFGQGGSGLEDYLTLQQTQGIQNQAMLQAASALLQAGGPSARPTSLGQAIGGALQAGQQGYSQAQTGAINTLMARQKLAEMQRDIDWSKSIAGGGTAAPTQAQGVEQTPSGAMPQVQPVGDLQPAAQSGPFASLMLTPDQRKLISGLPRKEGIQELMKIQAAQQDWSAPTAANYKGETVMVQYNKLGQPRIAQGFSPYAEVPSDIRALEYVSGQPLKGTGAAGIGAIQGYRKAGAVNVDMGAGQKGFENEAKLKSMFSGEPIYKDFNDMQSAYKQVKSSLAQENPIGDVAAATKIMKLLDPGSVVRESELGIAMAATGKMDRLQNYVQNWSQGTKLTPTQRQDFQNLANELYAAAGQTYNMKRNEYADFGAKYDLDANKALGAPAKLPSIMTGTGGAQRPPLSSFFPTTKP